MALSKQDAQDYIKKYIDSDFDHVFTCSTNIQAIIDVALNLGPIGSAVDAADRAEAAADGAEGAVAGVLETVVPGVGITVDNTDTRNPILNVTPVTPSTIGLNNVENTSDLDKQVAILAAADANDVNLGNVDNTADSAKPISTAQQNALDLKENLISKDTAFNKAFGTNAGQVAEGNHTHSGGAGDLTNVDNTSDADKPLSNESIAALALKADKTQVLTDVPAGAVFTDTNTIFVHPTTDGNKHIPADLGAEEGKVLTATSTAGLYSWEEAGVGDMLQTIYDTNANGIVDAAESITFEAYASETMTVGEVVFISGYHAPTEIAIVSLADITDGEDLPAVAIVAVGGNTTDIVTLIHIGALTGNTNAWEVGDILYLGTNGAMTSTKTTPAFQQLAIVTRKSASDGRIAIAVHIRVEDSGIVPVTTKGDLITYDTDSKILGIGTNDQVLTADSTAAEGMAWKSGVVDISTFIQGVATDGEKLMTFVASKAFTLASGLTDSKVYAEVTPTANATINVNVNGVNKGTINIALGANTATFTFASPVVVAVGDRVQLVAQGTADATLADIAITLRGNL